MWMVCVDGVCGECMWMRVCVDDVCVDDVCVWMCVYDEWMVCVVRV